jgi:hypothetical protein
MYRDRGRLAAKVPEQPLLSNPLSDPAERGICELSKPAPIVRRCLVAMSFFGRPQHYAEPIPETAEQTGGGNPFGSRVHLTRRFTIQLVAVAGDGYDKDVHRH